jgi:hypothetical protein
MARRVDLTGLLIWITVNLSYLIILLVLAVALAPLSHFMPSKAQRKVARLREYAALQGLFVEFREPPAAPGRAPPAKAQTIYYGKRVHPGGRGPLKRVAWTLREDSWVSVPRGGTVPEGLLALPADILAASADQDSCGIYWQETGEEAEVEQISRVLSDLAGVLYQ